MTYLGMDVHKSQTTFCAVDEAGAVVSRGRVPSDGQGWRSLVGAWPANEVHVAVETGSLTWWLVDVLRECGVEPTVVDARQFKLIASSRKKSDRRDAFLLADALRAGLAQRCAVVVPSETARRGRSLLEARGSIVKHCTAARNSALGLLRSVGLRAPLRVWASDDRWAELLTTAVLPQGMRELLEVHRSLWKHATAQRDRLDEIVKGELQRWPEAKRLDEIPGYGPVVTLAVLSSIDDPARFRHGKQVASYGGLAPSVRNSGETVRHGGITHQGRKLLRHVLVQAAHNALRSPRLSPSLRRWVGALMMRRGTHVAAVALARRLLALGYQLLKTGQPYNRRYGALAANTP